MSETGVQIHTCHALLVVWGQFAHCIGLIRGIEAVSLAQKTVDYSPQTKLIEFLVAMLGGLPYMKDISRSACPIDRDQAVAQAWGQPGWADYSGVSRTLQHLSDADVQHTASVLDAVTQPFIDLELERALATNSVELDGDLSPRAVSDTSTTYPDAAFGRLNDQIHLGYQSAIVCLHSPTYGRIGLSATLHSGKTLSLSQAEVLAGEAERRLGRRPLRRTDLLAQRIERMRGEAERLRQRVQVAEHTLARAQSAEKSVDAQYRQIQSAQQSRHKADLYQQRLQRRQRSVQKALAWCAAQQKRATAWDAEIAHLEARLDRFQKENATNPAPIQAILRLDAGFGTADNLALLIEMGYELYSKPFGAWLASRLAAMSSGQTWCRVGKNAEMVGWKEVALSDFPYPLDLGYERFWTGTEQHVSGLVHFGRCAVASDLVGWFHYYNARQTIEAGNKEEKQVFAVHHLKVRSHPALRLQEHLALFCANFVRLAARWMAEQCPQIPAGWADSAQPRVKEQVVVGAHTPAYVEWVGQDCLVRFDEGSVYAGRTLTARKDIAVQLTLPWKTSSS